MNIILNSCSPKANTLDLWHSSSHTAEQTLSEVTILVICDMASAQYVHCDNTSYIKARLRGGSSTFAAFIRSCQICVVKECLTWCVFPQGGSHHCTSEREHVEGTVLIWCTHTHKHMHTSANTKEQWQNCGPQRFLLPHFSFCQAVWISLCIELLWLLVRSSWSQRLRKSPKRVCEHARSMKYLTSACFSRIPTRVFINFQFDTSVPVVCCTSTPCFTCLLWQTLHQHEHFALIQLKFSPFFDEAFHSLCLLVLPEIGPQVETFAIKAAIVFRNV